MTFKVLDFKCALITGGSGGIGRAMAEHFLSRGKKVIICGRTESKLKEASSEMNQCPYYVFDTSDIPSLRGMVQTITKEHSDLDCLINNAGVQRPLDVNDMKADEFLDKADNEISTNINGPMHLTIEMLPHLKSKSGAVIMNLSSVLGYNPTSIINPVYNGTKAWTHFWSMNLRTQLEQSGSNIRVVEIAPPTVSTDLHRERKDPNDNKKEKNSAALSVDEFIKEVVQNWENDTDVFGAGVSQGTVDKWHSVFLDDYNKVAKAE